MKQYRALLFVILFLIQPLSSHAAWQSDGSLKVAVLDIVSRVENENIDAVLISEMLQARLVDKKVFKIVERSMLNKILEENKLRMMGLTDADASAVGVMAGAEKIVMGSISRIGDQYVILVKGIDTKTGIVELTDQLMSPDMLELPAAVRQLADRIVQKARGAPVDDVAAPKRKERIVLDERFQNNQNGWTLGEWDSAAADLKNGQYIIRKKAAAPIFQSKIDVMVDQGRDYSIDATVAKLSGANENLSYYGIIFGKDFQNMYEFLVHSNGKCMVRLQQNGETTFIQPSASSAYVRHGDAANDLRIEKEGGVFKFYLNGQFVTQHRPQTAPGNAFLIGYEVWRTEGEKLTIAGKKLIVSQVEPAVVQSDAASLQAAVPPAEGEFTAWMDGDAFGKEMDRLHKDGYYPVAVEGRNHDGTSEYRAIVNPFPNRVWWFYWWYGQVRSAYEDHKKQMTTEGFKEIHLQVFTDREGMKRYQTCWVKYGS